MELMMIIAAVTIMGRAANMENKSSFAWGGITLLLCLVSLFTIPLPLLRIVAVLAVMFAAWIALRIYEHQRARRR